KGDRREGFAVPRRLLAFEPSTVGHWVGLDHHDDLCGAPERRAPPLVVLLQARVVDDEHGRPGRRTDRVSPGDEQPHVLGAVLLAAEEAASERVDHDEDRWWAIR